MMRKSVRAQEAKEISAEICGQILRATLRAPTAGNLMLCSRVHVTDHNIKNRLAITRDNQPCIFGQAMYFRKFDPEFFGGMSNRCA